MSRTIEEFLQANKFYKEWVLIGPLWKFDPALIQFSKTSLPMIFVDGGSNFLDEYEVNLPNKCLTLGDGDSTHWPMDLMLNPEKDFTDFQYALELIPKTVCKIYLFGFLGGRKDHEWGNLGAIHQFLKKRKAPAMAQLSSDFTLYSKGEWEIDIREVFSILCLEAGKIKITGNCRYQLKKWTTLEVFSGRGISNRGEGKVLINAKVPFIIALNPQLN